MIIFDSEEEVVSTNATTNWVTKLEVAGQLPGQDTAWYKLFVCCEYSGSLTNQMFEVQVLLDGIQRSQDVHRPPAAQEPRKFMDFGLVNLAPGQHSLTLQFRPRTSGTAYCRRARILVEKY